MWKPFLDFLVVSWSWNALFFHVLFSSFSALLHLLLLITRSCWLSSSTIVAGAIFVRLNKILIRVRTSFLIRSVNSYIEKYKSAVNPDSKAIIFQVLQHHTLLRQIFEKPAVPSACYCNCILWEKEEEDIYYCPKVKGQGRTKKLFVHHCASTTFNGSRSEWCTFEMQSKRKHHFYSSWQQRKSSLAA